MSEGLNDCLPMALRLPLKWMGARHVPWQLD